MLLFLVTPCHVVTVQPCMEWITIKKNKVDRHPRKCSSYSLSRLQTSFWALLVKDNLFISHRKNVPLLLFFGFSKNSAFCLWIERYGNCLARSNIHSTHLKIESIANIAPKIWSKIPSDIKEVGSLTDFKIKTKRWIPQVTFVDTWGKWVLWNKVWNFMVHHVPSWF